MGILAERGDDGFRQASIKLIVPRRAGQRLEGEYGYMGCPS